MSGTKKLGRPVGWLVLVLAILISAPGLASEFTFVSEHELDTHAQFSEADEQGRFVHLITFIEPGLLERFRSTRSQNERFDSRSPQMQAALADIRSQHQQHISAIGSEVGRSVNVTHRYTASHSGIAVRLTPEEARAVEALRNVVAVERERVYELDTYRGPDFIGANTIWSGASVPGGSELLGAGMVAGVLDSAVDITVPSFADDVACGHGDTAPPKVLSNLNCASTDDDGLCNGPPIASSTHGTHVSGTVLGNFVDVTADPAPDLPDGFDSIAGVAPCASLRAYAVCPVGCPAALIQAGMNSILLHGDVDVMSFSISGGASPWNDNDRRKLDLVAAGVFVAASAGNTSGIAPEPVGNVNHRGPWVTTVAASTHDVAPGGGSRNGDVLAGFSLRGPTPAPLQNLQKPDITAPGVDIYASVVSFEFSVSGPEPVPEGLVDVSMRPGSASPIGSQLTDHPITFDPDQPSGGEGCVGFPAGFFEASVALIQRGQCSFSEKINNAVDAGADMVIIWNNEPGGISMLTDDQDPNVAAFSITQAAGQELIDFITANPTATINYSGQAFSQYDFASGTSMSSPHVVGAGLLILQAHPDWTPVEVRSALQMTAVKEGTKEDQSTPWDPDDVGSGRVDLTRAALAGLVMHETFDNFLAANPTTGGDVRTLNLPAMRDLDCSPECSFTRTVRNTLDVPSSWSVSFDGLDGQFNVDVQPADTFSFTGDLTETQTLTFTFSAIDNQTAQINFGQAIFAEDEALSPGLHFTIALSGLESLPPVASIGPDSFSFLLEEGGSNSATLNIANLGEADLNYSIAQAEPSSVALGGERDGPAEAITLALDSGLSSLFNGGDQQWLWMNQFTPGPLDIPFTLEEIDIGFAPGNGDVLAGDLFDVYVWTDPDRDPTTGADFMVSVTGQAITAGVNFQTVILPDGGIPITADSGDVLIGVVNRTSANLYPVAAGDAPGNSQRRSWVGLGGPGSVAGSPPEFDQLGLFALNDDLVEGRNWAIRGFGTGGSACLAPSDVSWLSATPDQGSVAGGANEDITITVDMTGLGIGTYEARLCIETSDPELPTAVVPISVDVVEEIQLPEADVSPASFAFTVELPATDNDDLLIGNTGDAELLWNLLEPFDLPIFPSRNTVVLLDEDFSSSTFPPAGWSRFLIEGNPQRQWTRSTTEFNSSPAAAVRTFGSSSDGNQEDWLVTPPLALRNAPALSFIDGGEFMNDYGFSGVLASTGSCNPADGDFTLLAEIDDTPGPSFGFTWRSASVEIDLSAYANQTICLAFLYEGDFAHTWGIDDVMVTSTEPLNCYDPSEDPWLSVDATSGAVQSGDPADVINVMVDSDGLAPGSYETTLCVYTNDPNNALITVPVGMELEMPATFAILEGTVESLGLCSASPFPADGAEITIVGELETIVTTTDQDGFYQVFLDAGNTDVDITATAPVHLDGFEIDVALVAQETTVVDFGLVLDAACAEFTPEILDFGEVSESDTAMLDFTLSNTAEPGTASLQLSLLNVNGDGEFTITGGDCAVGVDLDAGESCTVEVTFSPTAVDTFSGQVNFFANNGQFESVGLSGTGVAADGIFQDRFEEPDGD